MKRSNKIEAGRKITRFSIFLAQLHLKHSEYFSSRNKHMKSIQMAIELNGILQMDGCLGSTAYCGFNSIFKEFCGLYQIASNSSDFYTHAYTNRSPTRWPIHAVYLYKRVASYTHTHIVRPFHNVRQSRNQIGPTNPICTFIWKCALKFVLVKNSFEFI